MASRCFRLSVVLALVATACDCGEGPPPDDTFDGNIIVGDGTVSDGAIDATEDASTDIDASSGDSGGEDAIDASDATIDAGDRCSEPPVGVFTASAAVDQVGALAGMIVEITGTATETGLSCSAMACPPEMPCCNTCTATITIEGVLPLVGGSCFSAPGCSGSECAQTCSPALLGLPQRFRGELLDRGGAGPALELFSVEN